MHETDKEEIFRRKFFQTKKCINQELQFFL